MTELEKTQWLCLWMMVVMLGMLAVLVVFSAEDELALIPLVGLGYFTGGFVVAGVVRKKIGG
jgi:hypothetical protein